MFGLSALDACLNPALQRGFINFILWYHFSKEPSLEDKIQDSLRENLKEIGQRCIQELREFIERLREEDEADMTS